MFRHKVDVVLMSFDGRCYVNVSVRPVADPQTYGKLTLNVELAGAARLHRAASVLMDGLELSGAHI